MQLFAFPSSALLACTFLLVVFALHRYAHNAAVVRLLRSLTVGRVLLAVGALLLAVEGTWAVPLHGTVFFAVYALVLLLSLGLTLLDGIKRKARPCFLLSHLGIFLIVWAALFGAPDVSRSKMMIGRGDAVNVSYADNGLVIPLPFSVALNDFVIDYYSDGKSPRQFTSHLFLDGQQMQTSVNNPCSHKGYTFYQYSYDHAAGRYTVLLLVRDPWLPVVYVGMLLLAVGAVMMLFGRWKARFVVPITLVLTVLFTVFSVAKINFGTLMPALRSWWFVPHLFIYMVAYSLMAMSLIVWLSARFRQKDAWRTLSDNLLRSSSALLIIGMLTGSVWARQAWGDYWAWDPKENWAAVTWLLSLMHLHLSQKRGWWPFVILLLAFLALQITWYGVNYLPSAMHSLHTYNS